MNDTTTVITTTDEGVTVVSSTDANEGANVAEGIGILAQLPPDAVHADLRRLVESEQRRISELAKQ